jgi:hypothetical protein
MVRVHLHLTKRAPFRSLQGHTKGQGANTGLLNHAQPTSEVRILPTMLAEGSLSAPGKGQREPEDTQTADNPPIQGRLQPSFKTDAGGFLPVQLTIQSGRHWEDGIHERIVANPVSIEAMEIDD